MRKILIICGPTASGKTALALDMAFKFYGELVSADSRQVYKSLNIGTCKDVPPNFEFKVSGLKSYNNDIGYFTDGQRRLWGYDLVEPTEVFSISQYVDFARIVIDDIWKRKKLPIIVGGSGLYIKAIIDGIDTVYIPRNEKLRNFLSEKKSSELYEILAQNNPVKAGSLNSSDRNNKRRLIRAIEIAVWEVETKEKNEYKKSKIDADYLFIGLKANKNMLKTLIVKRVMERLNNGFQEEVERLLMSGVSWNDQAMQSLGYKQIKDYFYGKNSKQEFVESWIQSEMNYIKRQITWFKKEKNIIWFDITKENWAIEVENEIIKWHNNM